MGLDFDGQTQGLGERGKVANRKTKLFSYIHLFTY